MDDLLQSLRRALEIDAVSTLLDSLVAYAEMLVDQGEKCRAAEVLALAQLYPMHVTTAERADGLMCYLETSLCPSVLYDARARAEQITLEDMVNEILDEVY